MLMYGVIPMEKVSHSKTPKLHTSLSVVKRPKTPAEGTTGTFFNYWHRGTDVLVVTAGQTPLQPTVVQGLRSRPFDRNLPEAALCRVDAIVLLTGHPKVADLQHVVLCDQTVPCRQVPFKKTTMNTGGS